MGDRREQTGEEHGSVQREQLQVPPTKEVLPLPLLRAGELLLY